MASLEEKISNDAPIVVDATDHIAGRLSSNVAKLLLKGNRVSIVNCDKKGYEEYKRISNQKNLEKQELDNIKKDIDEIKTMLRQIING